MCIEISLSMHYQEHAKFIPNQQATKMKRYSKMNRAAFHDSDHFGLSRVAGSHRTRSSFDLHFFRIGERNAVARMLTGPSLVS